MKIPGIFPLIYYCRKQTWKNTNFCLKSNFKNRNVLPTEILENWDVPIYGGFESQKLDCSDKIGTVGRYAFVADSRTFCGDKTGMFNLHLKWHT